MADYNTRARIIYEAEVANAKRAQEQLRREVLEGTKTVDRAAKEWQRYQRSIKNSEKVLGPAKGGFGNLWKQIGVGVGVVEVAKAGLDGLRKGLVEVGKATLVAAQIQETGNVLQFIGKQAGYSRQQITGYQTALRASGIAQKETNQALLRAIQAQINLNDAVKLGRLAQDAAVIGLTDSSEAYERLINAIAKRRPILLRELGILINLDDTYAAYAKTVNKAVNELTEAEQTQAFINAVMEKGNDIAGAYTTAMENVSKRMRSLPRLFQDAQQAVGQWFVPALGAGIDVAEQFLEVVTRTFGDSVDLLKMDVAAYSKLKSSLTGTAAEATRLGAEYDRLTSKISLNADERERLNQILQRLQQIMPGIISARNEEGNAIAANTSLIEKQNSVNQTRLLLQQQELLTELADTYKDLTDKRSKYLDVMRQQGLRARGLIGLGEGLHQEVKRLETEKRRLEQAQFDVDTEDRQASVRAQLKEITAQLDVAQRIMNGTFDDGQDTLQGYNQGIDDTVQLVGTLFGNLQKDSAIGRRLIKLFGKEFVDMVVELQNASTGTGTGTGGSPLKPVVDDAEKRLKELQRLQKEMAQAGQAAEFEAQLQGLDEFQQERLKIEREYQQRKHDIEKNANDTNIPETKQALVTAAEVRNKQLENLEYKHQQELLKIRRDASMEADQILYDAQLSRLSEYQAKALMITQEYGEQIRALELQQQEYQLFSEEDFSAHRNELVTDMNNELLALERQQLEQRAQAWLEKYAFINAGISGFFSSLTSAIINNGKVFKEAIKSMGTAVITTLGQMAAKYIAMQIALAAISGALADEGVAVAALTKKYVALAAAKSAVSPWSATERVGAAAFTKSALLGLTRFDDPINDALLRRENRRIARFSAEGIAQGFNEIVNRRMALATAGEGGANANIGDVNIIVQGSADQSVIDQIDDYMRNEFPQRIKDGMIHGFTSERLHGR